MRLALYFTRKASSITTSYQILADKALTQVVQTALGLPPGIIISNSVVILFPGPYGVCADPVALAGSVKLRARPPAILGDGQH